MSHIQSHLHPELPAVNGQSTDKLSRLSTKESITSVVALVKPSNQGQRPRSTSRSSQYQSWGRGGAGNARLASDFSQRAYLYEGPDNFSSTKGRELLSLFQSDKIISTGRGGTGNVRSPLQDVIGVHLSELPSQTEAEQAKYERSLMRKHEAVRAARVVCPRPIELESCCQAHERTPIKAFGGKRWRRKHCLPIPVKVLKYKDADYLIVRS